MPEQCVVGDWIIRVGDCLIANGLAQSSGICNEGTEIKVLIIQETGEDKNYLIGIESKTKIEHWHNLDGKTRHCRGYWIRSRNLLKHFDYSASEKLVIADEIKFRRSSLKGMSCKLLISDPRHNICFVELEKNIGAGGADGLGRGGHCIQIPMSALKKKEIKENK